MRIEFVRVIKLVRLSNRRAREFFLRSVHKNKYTAVCLISHYTEINVQTNDQLIIN